MVKYRIPITKLEEILDDLTESQWYSKKEISNLAVILGRQFGSYLEPLLGNTSFHPQTVKLMITQLKQNKNKQKSYVV